LNPTHTLFAQLTQLTQLTRSPLSLLALFALLTVAPLTACGSAPHGRVSALSANAAESSELCQHRVPASVCTRCEPKREAVFKAVNDWCDPHGVPESQCHECHPDLTFEPLPQPPDDADLSALQSAQAPADMSDLAVQGKVTVVDVWAIWCVPCRRVAGDLNLLLQHDKTLAVRKVEIASWEDPFVTRALSGSPKLPLLVVYNAKGEEVGRLSGHDPARLEALISAASAP
jgi:thiol-disulfide isomerase/thioredoxin